MKFCKKYSRPPLPVSGSGLCQFVACLAGEGLTHGSVKAYLAAVRQMQVEAGLGNPGLDAMAKLKQVIRRVQRLREEQGAAAKEEKAHDSASTEAQLECSAGRAGCQDNVGGSHP